MLKVDIIVLENTILEALAIRASLESFNILVRIYFIGNVKELINILSKPEHLNEIIILCCHGQDGKLFIPKLDKDLEQGMPYKDFLVAEDCKKFINFDKQIIINTGCCLGEDFANAFLLGGVKSYIGSIDYIEGNAATFFVISLLYFHLCKEETLEKAYNNAISNDTGLEFFKLWSQ